MAINFPSSPLNGDIYVDTGSGNRYVYDSGNTAWLGAPNTVYNIATGSFTVANAAFGKANAALANTSGVYFNGNLYFPSGNIGIGTTTTSYNLQVANGTIVSSGSAPVISDNFFGLSGTPLTIQPAVSQWINPTYTNTLDNRGLYSSVSAPQIITNGYITAIYGYYGAPRVVTSNATDRVILYGGYFASIRSSNTDISTASNSVEYGVGGVAGHYNGANVSSSYTSATAAGGYFASYSYNGTITNIYGGQFGNYVGAAAGYTGSATNAYGIYISGSVGASSGTGTGTLTNYYDAYLAGVTVQSTGTVTNKYGVWQNAADHLNYFAGNTAIGTSGGLNYTAKFRVYTVNQYAAEFYSASTNNSTVIVLANDQSLSSIAGNSSSLTFQTGGASGAYERMRIDSSGKVGIGTTSPTQALHVKGLINSSDGDSSRSVIGWTTATTWGGAGLQLINVDNSNLILGTNNTGRVQIDVNGNVAIGQATTTYKLQVNGSFAATTKSFVIDHPTKPGMKLRYGSLEGPENGVYIRGRLTKENHIQFPDYWVGLVDHDTITVQLTPIGKSKQPSVGNFTENGVNVLGNNIDCFYYIMAERKDVEKLVVEF